MHEKPYRSVVKAISWRTVGTLDTIIVSYFITGNLMMAASIVAARPENKGKTIVTILCDTGERYLSSGLYDYDE